MTENTEKKGKSKLLKTLFVLNSIGFAYIAAVCIYVYYNGFITENDGIMTGLIFFIFMQICYLLYNKTDVSKPFKDNPVPIIILYAFLLIGSFGDAKIIAAVTNNVLLIADPIKGIAEVFITIILSFFIGFVAYYER